MQENTVTASPTGPLKVPQEPKKEETIKLDTPTVASGHGWMICNCSLGCGSYIFQGWSEGIGIYDNSDFEKKLFTLLYSSMHQEHVRNPWNLSYKGRHVEAPIGVLMSHHQFLVKGTTYTFNSTVEWVARLVEFVKKHDLGEISVGHVWINTNYKQHRNQTGTWTWNGKVPKSTDVGITNWKLPEHTNV